MKEPTTFELIKWCLKETYRPSRVWGVIKKTGIDYVDILQTGLEDIRQGLVSAFVILILPLLVVFKFIMQVAWHPFAYPIFHRDKVLKAKYELETKNEKEN